MIDKWDIKYIIRRVVVAIVITILLSLLGACNAKADTFERVDFTNHWISTANGTKNIVFSQDHLIPNHNGYLIFSIYATPNNVVGNNNTYGVFRVEAWGSITTTCDIGSTINYKDTMSVVQIYTVKCPVKTNSNGLTAIALYRYSDNGITIELGDRGTFVTEDSDATAITQAIGQSAQATVNEMQTMNSQLTDIKYQNERNISAIVDSRREAHQDAQQQHQDLQDINNSINNDTAPTNNEISGNTTEWNNKNISNNTITQLLTMPLTLINAYLNGINGTCSNFNLGSLYGTDLILPCINVANFIGLTLWSTIDILFSGFMIFNIGRKLIKIFNDFTNLNSNQVDELYGGGA